MNIGIIGLGFVGNAISKKFSLNHKIYTYDIIAERSNSNLEKIVKNCSVVFLCLPTPSTFDGKCELNYIFSTIKELSHYGYCQTCVIKSTVIPGTTESINKKYPKIKTIHNPEFLRERSAVEDFDTQTRIILGGKKNYTKLVAKLYRNIFNDINIIETNSTTSEMVKYYMNSFFSNKVSFANEMYEFCTKLNIDYNEVLRYVLTDKRIGTSHLNVPGFNNEFGFGGNCFPKDLDALICLAKELEIKPLMLEATRRKNKTIRNQ